MSTHTILIVDDEPANRKTIIRQFEEYDYHFMEANNGQEGLDALLDCMPDLILLDIRMPVKDGFGFLEQYNDTHGRTRVPVCVMTGMGDSQTRLQSVSLGADDFITKPFDPIELETRITSLLRISNFQRDMLTLNADLEKRVKLRTVKLQQALEELEESKRKNFRAYREMINRISGLSSLNQPSPTRMPNRVGVCAAAIAWLMGLPAETSENIALASQLHDIGMLALPERLRFSDPDSLNPLERKLYFSHALIGSQLFSDSDIPLLQLAHNICASHHEHFDGTGFPNGLRSQDIPLEARIFAIADTIVAVLQSEETRAVALENLNSQLAQSAGRQFDPEIVALLLQSQETLENLIDQCV
ncbi:MAG TPA: HD domain-containing phosphohydrolase [Candidatus Kapabacteria bacterium]|nr:HD domain-containing phosphohydrolase [Candidatus Kapabacteria bacterium]